MLVYRFDVPATSSGFSGPISGAAEVIEAIERQGWLLDHFAFDRAQSKNGLSRFCSAALSHQQRRLSRLCNMAPSRCTRSLNRTLTAKPGTGSPTFTADS